MPAKAFFPVGSGAGTYFWMASTRVNTRTTPAYRDIDALIDSERRFRLLVEGVIDYAIYMLDPNGIVTNWNAGAQRIKGYAPDEIIGQHFSIFYTPEERAAGLPAEALADRAARRQIRGRRLARPQGRHALLRLGRDRSDLRETGTWSASPRSPATSRSGRRRRNALLDSERSSGCWSAASPTTRCTCSIRTGSSPAGTPAANASKATRPTEIIGQHFSRFYTDATRPPAARRGRCRSHGETAAMRRKAGASARMASFFWASVVIDPIRDEDGKLLGFAKITRDITERREAQMKLEQVQRQLAESQKMDALGQLTGGVAHDFNNLLMVVSGQPPDARSAIAGRAESQRALHSAIETATQRGATLTRPAADLLPAAERQSADRSTSRDRIDSIRDVLASGAWQHGRAAHRHPTGVWPVTVDPAELEIALLNLVINARDAMPDGGTVTISAHATTSWRGEPLPHGEYVAIAVERHRRRHSRRTSSPGCSTRSSPPSRSARAPALGCRRSTASRIRPAAP